MLFEEFYNILTWFITANNESQNEKIKLEYLKDLDTNPYTDWLCYYLHTDTQNFKQFISDKTKFKRFTDLRKLEEI